MTDRGFTKGRWLSSLILVAVVTGTGIAVALMLWLGNWESWGLQLALRIVLGCCVVICLATILTRVTIFGWNFRRYFRWPGEGGTPPPVVAETIPRPARAPWYKSGAASFSITVVLVSLTGAAAVASAVLWILSGVLSPWVLKLVLGIIWASWWVLCIAMVLTRISIFGWHKKRTAKVDPLPVGTETSPEPPAPHDNGPSEGRPVSLSDPSEKR
jgi:hypothetical protein